MGNIRISVAVASYNGERYIKEQMDSIVRNLTCRDEIIVSDDGSSDRTSELVREYQNGEIPVRLLQGPGLGIKQNISAALSACRGDYIFLADQDDVWTDDKVEKVMEYLGKDGCRLVCHDARVMNASFTEVKMESFFSYRGSKPGFLNNLLKNRYMGCCMAFEKSLLPYVLPISEKVEMHDQWIGMINDLRGGNSRFIGDRLLLYRRHDANVSDFSHGTLLQMAVKRLILLRELYKRKKLWKY